MNKLQKNNKYNSIYLDKNTPYINNDVNQEVSVGVLTTPKMKGRRPPLPVGKDSILKQEMIKTAKTKGIFMFFFYPYDINFNKNTVRGHTYIFKNNKRGDWVRGIFSLPDIVYNRLSYRRNEARRSVKKLLETIENNPNMYLFNSRFLNKWEVHTILSQNKLTKHLVPETVLFNRQNLYIMLDKYQELFIKPINKSIGKGIIIVRKNPNNKGFYHKLAATDKEWRHCKTINSLYRYLKTKAVQEECLIQSSIDLAMTANRLFDLRMEVQKDDHGKWVFTGVGVRIAAPGRYCTHVPNGGSRAEYNRVIKNVFGNSTTVIESLQQQIDYITRVVPNVLEKNLGINLGILSIDIGLNKSGIMQIIEINSKPSSFDERDIRKKHLENLNKYFLYLHSRLVNRRGE